MNYVHIHLKHVKYFITYLIKSPPHTYSTLYIFVCFIRFWEKWIPYFALLPHNVVKFTAYYWAAELYAHNDLSPMSTCHFLANSYSINHILPNYTLTCQLLCTLCEHQLSITLMLQYWSPYCTVGILNVDCRPIRDCFHGGFNFTNFANASPTNVQIFSCYDFYNYSGGAIESGGVGEGCHAPWNLAWKLMHKLQHNAINSTDVV